jgi:hypothetical protein
MTWSDNLLAEISGKLTLILEELRKRPAVTDAPAPVPPDSQTEKGEQS